MVLAHGITDDGLCWSPVAEVLEAKYAVIMADARTYGKSEAPADGYLTDSGIGYDFLEGHTYAFRLPTGNYALMYVSQVVHLPPGPTTPPVIRMQISYKYQPNGSRTF